MSVEVTNLEVSYGGKIAVKHLSMRVDEGKMLVLLGPSGCGKTSTMRSIAGLENPTGGSIVINDRTVFDPARSVNVPPHQRQVGMVFQSYAIWPHRTVFQNVAFPLEMQRLPKAEIRERVEEALETVGLPDFASRGASLLSGGQMQRVALARSLVMRPDVLLLDEPLSNLDAKLRERLRFELRELQTELNLTAIYVTHDQGEALALADLIVVMKLGEIAQSATPKILYEKPANRFVADFLGVSNIFDGAVDAADRNEGASVRLEAHGESLDLAQSAPAGEYAVCIRPEAVELSRAKSIPPAGLGNRLSAQVKVANYLGSHIRYRVETETGWSIEVESFRPTEIFAAGDMVDIRIPSDAIQLLEK